MTLRLVESFEIYAVGANPSALMSGKYKVGTADTTAIVATGRNGKGFRSVTNGFKIDLAPTAPAKVIVGHALKVATAGFSGTDAFIMSVQHTSGSASQVAVSVRSDGALQIRYGSGYSVLVESAAGVLPFDTWVYFEAKFEATGGNATLTLRINGLQVMQSTVVPCNSVTSWNDFILLGGGYNANIQIDDLYFCDGAGTTNNDFRGDCNVRCLRPTGNGANSQFAGSDGDSVNNYALVNEAPVDDASYVQSATVNNEDTYAHADLPDALGSIFGVQVVTRDAYVTSAQNLAHLARLAGTDLAGADITLGSGLTQHWSMFETKPGGGTWAIADVNAAEFGFRCR